MQADALEPEQWREQLQGAVGVVSCLGGFGSNEYMLKVYTCSKQAPQCGAPLCLVPVCADLKACGFWFATMLPACNAAVFWWYAGVCLSCMSCLVQASS